ncbi:hypothetical protein HKX48_003446 [Thoreauomyces humboldtii]|nr:hypothetical protein HKX48_003446 [Thoreauomyces humboldtii]
MVRTHYLNELVDVLRTAKSVEKRAMAEMFLVKVVEREIERVASHVTRKIKGLTAEIESVRSGMGRLTTPFGLSQKLLYLIRSFLESYVTENKSLEKQFPVPALASCRKNLGSYAERHQALDAYFVDMKRDAKELVSSVSVVHPLTLPARVLILISCQAAKCKTDFVAESLKAFVKMEAEMLLIEKFTTHATAELMSVIGSIEEMTQDL